ncbi:hypothetical protein [Nocardiopsis oceani]
MNHPTLYSSLLIVVLFGLAACVFLHVKAHRWNRARGRPGYWSWAPTGETTGHEERRRVRHLVRSGETAPDAATAHLTVRVAQDLRLRWENPWAWKAQTLVFAIVALNTVNLILNRPGTPWMVLIAALGAAAALTAVVPYQRRRDLRRVGKAVRANEDLAAEAPEEPPERAPEWGDQWRKPY